MGTKDVAPPLVWPQSLELPSADVPVIYLDLNHWIHLAQSSAGHLQGTSFEKTLEACRTATSAGSATFVLSLTHYVEVGKIKDAAQRFAVAKVMEELTNFSTLLNRPIVMRRELAAVFDRFTGESHPLPSVPLVGRGVFHMFGRRSGIKFSGPAGDATKKARKRLADETFNRLVDEATLALERSSLGGPADSQIERLRSLGWRPETVVEVADKRADEERKQSRRLDGDPHWRRGRLRDLMAARELIIEFENMLLQESNRRGKVTISNVLSDRQTARRFVRSMPSTEVALELKTAWHRNRDKPWEMNDIHDIDAMALAVPYCNIVVTEKACHHVLQAAHLGERMHTTILRDLNMLPNAIARWRPV